MFSIDQELCFRESMRSYQTHLGSNGKENSKAYRRGNVRFLKRLWRKSQKIEYKHITFGFLPHALEGWDPGKSQSFSEADLKWRKAFPSGS